MTWTGGSAGLSFAELLPGLREYVRLHPDVTLEGILTNPPRRDGTLDVGYDGLGVLCAMIHDKGGITAIRRLVSAGADPEHVLNVAAEILAVPRRELDELWRQRIVTSRARVKD